MVKRGHIVTFSGLCSLTHKPIAIVDSGLQWVERLVQRPAAREVFVAQRAALSTLLEPCFERFVEFNEWQGRTLRWWNQPVDVKITAPLRTRAMAIIRQVIEQDSWRLALEGIGAAERALHRVAGVETSHVSQAEKFREEWRPERLKAQRSFRSRSRSTRTRWCGLRFARCSSAIWHMRRIRCSPPPCARCWPRFKVI